MKHALSTVLLVVTSLAVLTVAQDFVDVNNPNLAEDDARRYYYCGNSFWDAIDKCGTWCPNDDDAECPDGEECFGDTYCKYTADLDAGGVAASTISATTNAVTTNSATTNSATYAVTTNSAATNVASTNSATTYAVTTNSATINAMITTVPIENLTSSSAVNTVAVNPTPQPSQATADSIQPTWQTVAADEGDEDWSLIQEGDSSEEDDDRSQVETTENLWCGESQFDAIRNCGTGTRCDNGICPDGLKCFMVPTSCGGTESEVGAAAGTTSTVSNADAEEDWSAYIGTSSTAMSTTNSTENEDWSSMVNATTPASSTVSMANSTTESFTNVSTTPTNHPVDYGYSWTDDNATITSPTFAPEDSNTSTSFLTPEIEVSQDNMTDTLFCGYTLEDASTACHQRCRSGSPGECPAGETCFRGVECTSENPRPPPTQKPTIPPTPFVNTSNLCAADYLELTETCWLAIECNSTNECPQNLTCFENIDCFVTSYSASGVPTISPVPSSLTNSSVNISVGTKQNYCALDEMNLYANCSVAPTCNDGDPPCPSGLFCFGEHICGSEVSIAPSKYETQAPSQNPSFTHEATSSSPIPNPNSSNSEPQLLCASDMSDLEASCSTAPSCNDGPCPPDSGLYCFPYTCESSVVENPVVPDGKTYYCAQNEAELKESCDMLTQCNNGFPSCNEGYTCFEYECLQSVDLCPLNFVGWQSSLDCLEYYGCEHGVAGDIKACPDGLKFDKMRGECVDGQLDEYCYGAPVPPPTPKPTGPPLSLCPSDFNGWHASLDCKEYYMCQEGEAGAIQVCGEGLSFDKVRNKCITESDVNNFCYGPPLEETEPLPVQTESESPQAADLNLNNNPEVDGSCSNGYTGWQASSDCSQYYWCDKGIAANKYDCGDGLLFDTIEEVCTFADDVKCGEENSGNTVTPSPTASPSQPVAIMGTTLPTTTRDKVWSDTASPTILSKNSPADPPWLSVTRKDGENSAITNSIAVCLQLQVFIYLVIQFY